jgi:hypothetical protein
VKWRCPTRECSPASTWIKADRLRPLVPRETKRWRELYRSHLIDFEDAKNRVGPVLMCAGCYHDWPL